MYSIALAIEDYVPVILSAAGLWTVTRLIRTGAREHEDVAPSIGGTALAASALIVAGGVSRATWKLIIAGGGPDVGALYLALFPALVVGYLTLATAAWLRWTSPGSRRGRATALIPAAVAVALLIPFTVALQSPDSRTVPLAWLLTGAAGSGALSLLLARRAWRRGLNRLGWLFVLNLAVTLALNGVARAAQASEGVQWVQQLSNTGNQALFLVAARRLAAIADSPDLEARAR